MSGAGAVTAYVGLGANLGDARATIQRAVVALAQLPQTQLLRTSSLYRSAPVAATGPDFVNAVVGLSTHLAAMKLLRALQGIETAEGRERPFHHAPRTLDLDLLLYGDAMLQTDELTVPHPRLHERGFVLQPLAEIAPELAVPQHGSVRLLLSQVQGQDVEVLR
jgi:2-amino-4-hydroxy-6-hydroxymethyldihydropteridine diphosphokinase